MNDDDLITQLQKRLAERAETVDAPAGLADRARHGAQRRLARRAALAGLPSLAALVVAAVLLTGGWSGSVPAADAAFIARQVSAQLIKQEADAVLYTVDTSPPDTPTAGQRSISWDYVETEKHRDITTARTSNAAGSTILITRDVLSIVDGQAHDTTVTVDPVRRTWTRGANCYTAHPGPGFFANDSQLRQLIRSGRFQRAGTTIVAGQPALRLRLKLPAKIARDETETLYVNADTYRPIKETVRVRGDGAFNQTMIWLPATPANRARATQALPMPHGYRKVSPPGTAETRYLEGRLRKRLRTAHSAAQRRRIEKALAQYEDCS